MKEANRGLNAATKRFGTLSRPQLIEFVQRLRGLASNLETMCDAIPLHHSGVRIDGATKGGRAIELLEDYTHLVNEAVTN